MCADARFHAFSCRIHASHRALVAPARRSRAAFREVDAAVRRWHRSFEIDPHPRLARVARGHVERPVDEGATRDDPFDARAVDVVDDVVVALEALRESSCEDLLERAFLRSFERALDADALPRWRDGARYP